LRPAKRVVASEEVIAAIQPVVDAAIADSPLGKRAAAPAKELALFDQPSGTEVLPAPSTFVAGGAYAVTVPDGLLADTLEDYAARDGLPLPTTADREGYHGDKHFDYWLSGLVDWLKARRTLERHGVWLEQGSPVLDFGCASGRFLRHAVCQFEGLEVWGTDLNQRHVTWLLRNVPAPLKVFQCTTLPFLPLPDDYFRLATAFSVFTHIDEFELAWLAELRRVLEPGGIAYVTIHSDATWGKLGPGLTVYEHLVAASDSIEEYEITPALFRSPMPRDKVVFRWTSAALNNTNVFLSQRHVREVWGRLFEVLEIVREGASYQDVVVLRKPVGGSRG
jgi:SAM-dependent methyltransferase